MSRSKSGRQGQRIKNLQKRVSCCGSYYRKYDVCQSCARQVGLNPKCLPDWKYGKKV